MDTEQSIPIHQLHGYDKTWIQAYGEVPLVPIEMVYTQMQQMEYLCTWYRDEIHVGYQSAL